MNALDVRMPRLSESMSEGTIVRWLHATGAEVERGDELAEIETDKATVSFEADAGGVLEILAEEGATLPVGAVIARVGGSRAALGPAEQDGSPTSTDPAAGPASADAPPADPAPADPAPVRPAAAGPATGPASAVAAPAGAASAGPGAGPASAYAPPASSAPATPAPAGAAATAPAEPASVAAGPARGAKRVPASPLARRRAKELGVDLAHVQGTGPGGRIVRADIEAAAWAGKPAGASANGAAPSAPPAPSGTGNVPDLSAVNAQPAPAAAGAGNGPGRRGPVTVVALSRARQLTADRMSESARTVPSFPLTAEVDMTRALELRAGIAELGEGAVVPTVTDLVVAACGRALREHPRVNASYREGTVAMFGRVNIGVAVDATDALLVPAVTDVDTRSLTSIAVRTRELAELARSGRIGPADLEGATFTVSNLGMFGVTVFEAVINPPQAAILAVGALRRLPREIGGEVQVRPVLTLTLTSDHRVLDGAEAARFLRRLVELLDRPLALLLDHPTTSEERA
jgi:pyruvate dehydrogenase E2 component (dihydrolipoamide acetyltransferase)